MKKFALAAMMAAPLMVNAPQASADVGLGLGTGNLGGTSILVPIRLGAFRIEPELGMRKNSGNNNQTMPVAGSNSSTNSATTLGAGFYFVMQPAASTEIQLGAVIGKSSVKSSWTANGLPTGSASESGTYIMPTVAGEYYFGNNWSLGASVSYVLAHSVSGTNYAGNGVATSTYTYKYSGSTATRMAVRYYF